MKITGEIFPGIGKIKYDGRDSKNPLAFKWYDSEAKVGNRKMKDHLRFAIAYWHSFCGDGTDTFGSKTRDFPYDGLMGDDRILKESDYLKLRRARYASFDKGNGALYEKGKLTLEDLSELAEKGGEPKKISGRQELYEQLINMYII